MGKQVSRAELAEIVGKSEQTISNWQSQGMPVELRRSGRQGNLYDTERVIDWLKTKAAGVHAAAGGAQIEYHDYNAEKARLTYHQANIAELDAETRRGNLWPLETVALLLQTIIGNGRAALLSIPGKFRNRVPELDARAYALQERLIREACDQLSTTELPGDVRGSLERYHAHLASAADPEPEPVGDDARRNH